MNELTIKTGSHILLPEKILKDIQPTLKDLNLSHWIKENNILEISQGYVGQCFGEKYQFTITPAINYLSTMDYIKLINPNNELLSEGNSYEFIENNQTSSFIIEKYIKLLSNLIKEGIPQKYIDTTKYSNFFSGNVDIVETYSRMIKQEKPFVKSNKQQLTINYFVIIILWQSYDKIIKAYPNFKNPYIEKIFFYVEKKKFSTFQINNFTTYFHRNESLLENCYIFAKIIINNMDIIGGNDILKSSLILNSNIIFEEFIAKLFNTLLPNEPFNYHEGKKTIANTELKNIVSIEPDIIYKGLNTIILDVKNKNYEKSFSNNDFFQLYTYCKAYNSKIGILIYPSNLQSESIKVLTKFDDKITFYAISIDITKKNYQERIKSYHDFIQNIQEVINFS